MKWVDRCLESLYDSSIPVDIFIVDNSSTDGTVEYLKSRHRYLKLIESKQNLGFGKANNLGFEFALQNSYAYVYLLNQDAWIFKTTLEELIKVHQQHDDYGILSPMHLNDAETLDYNFGFCCPKQLLSDLYCNKVQSVYETDSVMAAHWLLSRKCLEKTGYFSPSFPHYGEDNNYIHRIHYFKYKIGVVPRAKAIHDRHGRVESTQLQIKKMYLLSALAISNPNKNLLLNLLIQPFLFIKRTLKFKSVSIIIGLFKLVYKYPFYITNRHKSKIQFSRF